MSERVIHPILRPCPRWYVYVHYDPRRVRENDPRQIDHVVYVGKGTRARAWVDTRPSSPDHGRWLRDLQNDGFSPDQFVRIEKRRLTPDEALRLERQLIAFYRQNGALLFNKERAWSGPTRQYENKWMPDPAFGKMLPRWQPLTGDEVMTESDFKAAALRTEDETAVIYDLRGLGERQQGAIAWYLGHLVFRLSAHGLVRPLKPLILLVHPSVLITRQIRGFVKKLKTAGIPIEIRYSRQPDADFS